MTGATTLPDPVRAWAESVIGPLTYLGDTAAGHVARVWEVMTRPDTGQRFCVKLAASPTPSPARPSPTATPCPTSAPAAHPASPRPRPSTSP
ncbi:hypothetical protein N7U49_32990 [Streptomyces sp. AD2-2]|nr:hypothetical protein N7U49_32990 [Streptomyces sp. AD2-2]